MSKLRVACILFLLVAASFGQSSQSARVSGLHFQIAHSPDEAMSAAVATILSDPEVCCGRGSSLEDLTNFINRDLQQTAAKLQGRHVLPDGRPYILGARFYATRPSDGSIPAGSVLLSTLQSNHPLLMIWKHELYVAYGANYSEQVVQDPDGGSVIRDTVERLQLFDPVSGHHVSFDPSKDNWDQVEGVVTLTISPSSS